MDFKARYDKTKSEVIKALVSRKGYSEEDAKLFVAQDYEFGYDSVEDILDQIEDEMINMREMAKYF